MFTNGGDPFSLTLSFDYTKFLSEKQELTFAIVERFGEMRNVDFWGAVEVGDGLGNFDDLEVGTSGEVEFFRGGVEKGFGGRCEFK